MRRHQETLETNDENRCVAWLKHSELFPQMLREVPADLEAEANLGTCPATPHPALSCPALPCSILPQPIVSYPILSVPILPFCPVLSCRVLSCHVMPRPFPSCSVRSCSVHERHAGQQNCKRAVYSSSVLPRRSTIVCHKHM